MFFALVRVLRSRLLVLFFDQTIDVSVPITCLSTVGWASGYVYWSLLERRHSPRGSALFLTIVWLDGLVYFFINRELDVGWGVPRALPVPFARSSWRGP